MTRKTITFTTCWELPTPSEAITSGRFAICAERSSSTPKTEAWPVRMRTSADFATSMSSARAWKASSTSRPPAAGFALAEKGDGEESAGHQPGNDPRPLLFYTE